MHILCQVSITPSVHQSRRRTTRVAPTWCVIVVDPEKLTIFGKNSKKEIFLLDKRSIVNVHANGIKLGRMTVEFRDRLVMINVDHRAAKQELEKLDRLLKIIRKAKRGQDITSSIKLAESEIASPVTQSRALELLDTFCDKLVISDRVNYPKKFSEVLSNLTITNISLKSVDPRWFALRHLSTLALSRNQLGTMDTNGWLRFERIGQLPCLKNLDLSYNGIKTIPQNFLAVIPATLTTLNLAFNEIKSVKFLDIRHLLHLEALDLCGNYVEKLDAFFVVQMPKCLKNLNVCQNQLVYITNEIIELYLSELYLNDNPMRNLPRDLFLWHSIQIFECNNTNVIDFDMSITRTRFVRFDYSMKPELAGQRDVNELARRRVVQPLQKLAAVKICTTFAHKIYRKIIPTAVRSSMTDGLYRCFGCYDLMVPNRVAQDQIMSYRLGDIALSTTGLHSLVTLNGKICHRCKARQLR